MSVHVHRIFNTSDQAIKIVLASKEGELEKWDILI